MNRVASGLLDVDHQLRRASVVANRTVIRWLYRDPDWVAIPRVFAVSLGLQLLMAIVVPEGLGFDTGERPSDGGLNWVTALAFLAVAPLLETLTNFTLPHAVMRRWFPFRSILPFTLVGTLIFAGLHWYSFDYIVGVAALSYLWFVYYAILRRRGKNGFWRVSAVHFLRNLLAFTAIAMGPLE